MAPEPLSFTCPRCGRGAEASTYGPCGDCRSELRARFQAEGREIEVAGYEPKMNVVPNQVASKD
jgi:NMD protein affecting ribosome stability and mRNA decay